MTVIRPNSVSGITSITAQANEINFFRSNGTLAGLQLNGVNFNTTTGVSTFNNLDVGGVLTYQDVTNVDSVGIITARSTIDAQGDVSIADKIIHTGDTNTAIRFPSADTITFETAGSERVRITSDGFIQYAPSNMQIFADTSDGSDDHYLNLSGGGACAQTRGAQVVMYGNEKSNEQGRLLLMAGNSGNTNGSIDFYSGGSKKATITASGNFGVGTNNPTSKIDIHCGSDNTGLQITSTDAGAFASYYDNTGASTIGHSGTDLVLSCDPAGSVSNSNIVFQVDSNSEKFRITAAGSVNIGGNYTQTAYKAQITTGTNKHISFTNAAHDDLSDEGSGIIFSRQNDGSKELSGIFGHSNSSLGIAARGNITFHAGGSSNYGAAPERLRIDSSGRLLHGHAASRTVGTKTGQLQVINSGNNAAISIIQTNNAGSAPFLAFGKTRSANTTGSTIVQNGDSLGQILFAGADGTDVNSTGALITAQVDGTPGSNDMPGRLIFSTTADGSATSTERLRITSDGNTVFTDKDSGHIGGGFYSRTKSVTGGTTNNFMRFTLNHGALAGAIYLTCSNNAYSISKSYTFAVQYGDGSNVNLQSDSGPMGGVDFIVSCSTSASTHTFRVQNVGGATVEVNLTVVVGCANQDITYTEL